MKQRLEQLDELLEWGGTKKAVVLLIPHPLQSP